MPHTFDFLTLHLHMEEAEPPEFDLATFFIAPEIAMWEWRFARSFLHETLHYWEFLGSRYLLRLVDAEWRRIEYFERERAILPPDPEVAGLYNIDAEVGFSAYQLLESWTRLWETQIQDPAELLGQEGIEFSELDPNVVTLLNNPCRYKYPWHALEIAMTHGANNAVYGAPFRWMLDQVFTASGIPRFGPDRLEPNSTGPSYLCGVAFPTIVHAAFQHLDPVAAFKAAVRAICDQELHLATAWSLGPQYMELDWFRYYETFVSLVSGPDAPKDGPDRFHQAIIPPDDALAHAVRVGIEAVEKSDFAEPALDEACDVLARFHRPIIFAFMGFRPFRIALAHVAPPPIVYFREEGIVLHGFRMNDVQTERMENAMAQAVYSSERARRFRAAEKAAALNLPLDAFDLPNR